MPNPYPQDPFILRPLSWKKTNNKTHHWSPLDRNALSEEKSFRLQLIFGEVAASLDESYIHDHAAFS
jgi:hypothetical protein